MSAVGSGCFMSDPNIERGFFAMSIVNPTQRNRLAYRGVHVGRDMENYSKSKKKKSYEGEENITSEKEYKTYGQTVSNWLMKQPLEKRYEMAKNLYERLQTDKVASDDDRRRVKLVMDQSKKELQLREREK